MKISKSSLPLILGALAVPTVATAAEDISYTYLEADYVVQDVDLFEDNEAFNEVVEDFDDGDGFEVEGSLEFTDYLFAFGNYSKTTSDFTFQNDLGNTIEEGQDIKTLRVGLGFKTPMNARTDFIARGSYFDIDFGSFSIGAVNDDIDEWDAVDDAVDDLDEDSTDGFSLDAGLRSQLVYWLEGGAGVRYTSMDPDDDFSVFGNLLFEITQNMGVNVAADFGDNMSTYQLGFRYSF